MKGTIFLLCIILATCCIACSKKNAIAPVHGTINGKPAITLYGSSNKPTDYVLLDTAISDRKLSYDGIVFTYVYISDTNIFIMGSGTPAARGALTTIGPKTNLTITAAYTITFGSTEYTTN
jgi:hypothetical protein